MALAMIQLPYISMKYYSTIAKEEEARKQTRIMKNIKVKKIELKEIIAFIQEHEEHLHGTNSKLLEKLTPAWK